MPQEAESGKRFARDMRRIREARNLTVDDLHDETKIPLGLIQAFEETGLFDHPQFNRVYLRSFVRTYAQVIGVDADVALESLEDALAGQYEKSLAEQFLDEAPAAEPASDEDDGKAEPAEEKHHPPIVSTTAEGAAGTERSDRPEERAEGAPGEAEEAYNESEGTFGQAEETYAESEEAFEEPEEPYDESEEDAGDWAAQSPPSGRRTTAAGAAAERAARAERAAAARSRHSAARRTSVDRGGVDRRWVIGGAMVVIVAAVVWILASVLGDSEPQTQEPVAAVDTVRSEDTTAVQQPAVEPVALPEIGDTLDVHIIASQDKVDPIRVTVDDDLRRPYWIDQGDSMAFGASNRIVIEELLENISLSVEGIDYPTDRRDPQNRIVITRDSLENYFASLRGAP